MPASLVTRDQKSAIKMYLALMEEAKSRIEIIADTYDNKIGFPARMVREICYLQYRFLCEIIALACLVIHGDIKKTNALRKTYDPTKILKEMDKLKSHYYPQRMSMTKTGRQTKITGEPDKPHLTRSELSKLWQISGNFLHRGKMVNLGKDADIVLSLTPVKSDPNLYADIIDWSQKIIGLLSCHWIAISKTRGIIVTLKSQETERVKASVMDFDKNAPEGRRVCVSTFQYKEPDQ